MSNSLIPVSFEHRMRDQLGIHYLRFRESLTQPAPVSIRVNPEKPRMQHAAERVPWSQFGYYLPQRPVFTLDPFLHAGTYYVQEPSSMFIEQAVLQSSDVRQPLLVLDLCAAPGGKSTHLLSLLSKDSFLVCNEVIKSRASILSENLQKWGHTNYMVTNNDPKDFGALHGLFDIIIVDAPCSGEGLFRKDPAAMAEWSDENVALCSARQQRILSDVWPALKPGGILIYSTCTYSPVENEGNLNWLSKNRDVAFLPIKCDPAWGIMEVHENQVLGYQFFPHNVKGEGFFLSAIQKRDQEQANSIRSKQLLTPLSPKQQSIFSNWLDTEQDMTLIAQQDLVIAIPTAWMDTVNYLSQRLMIITKGTAIAALKHDKPIPEHAFALSNLIHRSNFLETTVSEKEAIAFLRKESFQLPSTCEKGFNLVTHEDIPLGWINNLGNRFNSLYPSNWRIRMAAPTD